MGRNPLEFRNVWQRRGDLVSLADDHDEEIEHEERHDEDQNSKVAHNYPAVAMVVSFVYRLGGLLYTYKMQRQAKMVRGTVNLSTRSILTEPSGKSARAVGTAAVIDDWIYRRMVIENIPPGVQTSRKDTAT